MDYQDPVHNQCEYKSLHGSRILESDLDPPDLNILDPVQP